MPFGRGTETELSAVGIFFNAVVQGLKQDKLFD